MTITNQDITDLLTECYPDPLTRMAQVEKRSSAYMGGKSFSFCKNIALQKITPRIHAIFIAIEKSLNPYINLSFANIPHDCDNLFYNYPEYEGCVREMLQKHFKITMEPCCRRSDGFIMHWNPSQNDIIQRLLKDLHKFLQAKNGLIHDSPPSSGEEAAIPPSPESQQSLPTTNVNEGLGIKFLSTALQDPIQQCFEQAIRGAKESVTLLTYSLSCERILRELKSAADRGLQVQIIHDASQPIIDDHGGKVQVHPILIGDGYYKMHHKLLVIDHSHSLICSGNVVSSAFASQGNCVLHISSKQIAERIEQLNKLYLSGTILPRSPLQLPLGDTIVTLFSNMLQAREMHENLRKRIQVATRRVFVAMYMLTNKDLIDELCAAARRGVNVRVILDRGLAAAANGPAFETLRKNNVLCSWYNKGMLHYKVALIDDALISGSSNWTDAAFRGNDETMLSIDPMPLPLSRRVQEWWERVEHNSTLGEKVLT